MSGASKRSHEDGGHSTPLKRAHDGTNFSNLPGKTVQLLGNDFHMSFEAGHDARSTKFQRIEPRDVDKRSLHRMSTSPSHCIDHPSTSENRSELKASKDARDFKTESRENMVDNREPCIDTKLDYQVGKSECDTRDARGNEKDLRSDRSSYGDFKGIIKFERESYATSLSHPSWKDSKEHIWAKRYTEPSSEGMDSWRITRHLHNTIEVGKEQPTRVEGVSESKVDLKAEEKLREKDKKKKDDRCRDFGEWDKDKNERRGSIQIGETSHEQKELKEERELDRWERERKDVQKDKEQNDQDKDLVKRESPNPYEKETFRFMKEIPEGSVKNVDQLISSSDLKWTKDDSWKGSDRDQGDKRRERDADFGDGYGQHGKCYDKEFEDGVEGDGAMERDRDAFSYGVQPRRRMLRSRGANQASQREPRFRSRARDIDGSQGKHDVSTVVYRASECMQEILRTWREFEASHDSKSTETSQNHPTLEIRIPVEYVTSTNRQVRGAQLWGTDVYTNDSDLVAVLMHTGFCCPTSAPAPSSIHELRATIRILPPQECYTSSLRNNVRSRSWGAGIGCSFRVDRCCIVKKGGNTIDLEPRRTHISTVEPTIAPISAERTMTTRAAASVNYRARLLVTKKEGRASLSTGSRYWPARYSLSTQFRLLCLAI
ncbi:hypothetical protein HPP92_003711 [Vanilla planifolia]|uniref:Uncharacterized protein n=1 Tax=Vanilla planifolia TaxID=51239 RepID=A0A835S2A2_VANPL|nr:hypothetical protein HPP92_003711 [Vanilla planifolia]